jgi:hypothetical protein
MPSNINRPALLDCRAGPCGRAATRRQAAALQNPNAKGRSFKLTILGGILCGALCLAGCYTNPAVAVFDTGSQLQVRSYQTRAFETADREKTLRAIIATMQDLGFVIDKADATLGSVSGTKLASYELRMTATVRPRGTTQLLVRVSAQGKPKPTAAAKPIEDPGPYRDFFAALSKSLFLEGQQVD